MSTLSSELSSKFLLWLAIDILIIISICTSLGVIKTIKSVSYFRRSDISDDRGNKLRWCPCFGAVAESLCGHAGVCVCQHFTGGAADSHHPRVPAQGRRQKTRSLVDGQQPGSEGNCRWSTQVGHQKPLGFSSLSCVISSVQTGSVTQTMHLIT